jgi:predicted dithiol-disulfide oxidoreductase (DUF899 family)
MRALPYSMNAHSAALCQCSPRTPPAFRRMSTLRSWWRLLGPDDAAGCATCSTIADAFDGFVVHLAQPRRHAFGSVAGALAKLQAYRRPLGWTFPWASSFGSDFNFDFGVGFTEEQHRKGTIEYNYERGGHAMDMTAVPEPVAKSAAMAGTDVATYTRERPGMSAFVREDGIVYHTYSTYARGLDGRWGMYQWLDRPKGRNEKGVWWRRHDEYER